MCNCIFGTETELALVVESKGVVRPAPRELAAAVIDDIANRWQHVPSAPPQHRLFLANGSCIYADIGGHPEIATAECCDPIELAAQSFALRGMLAESTRAVGQVYGIPIRLIANNVDYAFGGARTYGYHLNVLVEGVSHEHASVQLAPLLAAMPIVAGTGKASFVTGSPGFELSQRAQFMAMVTGKHTTDSRAMITAKDEALSNHGTRLHLICFDTPKSVYQVALIPAIMAITLKVIENGKDIAGPVTLADPIRALHKVSGDPGLNARLELRDGGSTTVADIHEHYIGAVGEYLGQVETPHWMSQMFALWREVITNLRRDPFAEVQRLDWVRKLVIFTKVLESMHVTWKEYSQWIYALASVRRLKATWPDIDPLQLTRTSQGRVSIRNSALGVLQQHLVNHGLSWKDFPRIWNAANQLCRRCLDFHKLSPNLIEEADQEFGTESPVTRQMVEKSLTTAPEGTRAVVRAGAICKAQPGATADWTYIEQNGKRLVMDDAYGKNAAWNDITNRIKKER
jgi:proteasome accessory factor A